MVKVSFGERARGALKASQADLGRKRAKKDADTKGFTQRTREREMRILDAAKGNWVTASDVRDICSGNSKIAGQLLAQLCFAEYLIRKKVPGRRGQQPYAYTVPESANIPAIDPPP